MNAHPIWALLVALWMTGGVSAQPVAELSGSVTDATGLPLTDVTITIEGPLNESARTNIAGQFTFPRLVEGVYRVTAVSGGFVPARQVVRVQNGQKTVISLTLMVQLLAEAMVTASKAGEADVQELPVAVSVLQASDLARMHDRTVEHLASRAPSVTFSQNTGLAQVTIRGIGTNAVFAGSDPSSAVYLDGVYLARPAMVLADFLDLDRAEVLRGPQGTLYGRNTVGGAINLVTRTPTNDVEASAQLIAGDQGTIRATARISGPIKSGRVMGSGTVVRGLRSGTGTGPQSSWRSTRRRGLDWRTRTITVCTHSAQRVAPLGRRDAHGSDALVTIRRSWQSSQDFRSTIPAIFMKSARLFPRRAVRSSPARSRAFTCG